MIRKACAVILLFECGLVTLAAGVVRVGRFPQQPINERARQRFFSEDFFDPFIAWSRSHQFIGVAILKEADLNRKTAIFDIQELLIGNSTGRVEIQFSLLAVCQGWVGACSFVTDKHSIPTGKLLLSHFPDRVKKCPEGWVITPLDHPAHLANFRRYLQISQSKDVVRIVDLYRKILVSCDPIFSLHAYYALDYIGINERDLSETALVDLLRKYPNDCSLDVIPVLMKLQSKKAIPLLINLAQKATADFTRWEAMRALGSMKAHEALPFVTKVAQHCEDSIALNTLCELHFAEAASMCLSCYSKTANASVRAIALAWLTKFGHPDTLALALKSSHSQDPSEKVQAYRSLQAIHDSRAYADLLMQLFVPDNLAFQSDIAHALVAIDSRATEPHLISAIMRSDWRRHSWAVYWLGTLKSQTAFTRLTEILKIAVANEIAGIKSPEIDWGIKEITEALLKIDPAKALQEIAPLASNPNRKVRLGIIEALGTCKDARAYDVLAGLLPTKDLVESVLESMLEIDYERAAPIAIAILQSTPQIGPFVLARFINRKDARVLPLLYKERDQYSQCDPVWDGISRTIRELEAIARRKDIKSQ